MAKRDDHEQPEAPRILRVARVRQRQPRRQPQGQGLTRRAMLRLGAGALGASALAAGCGTAAFDVVVAEDGTCQCHVVCTCDTDFSGTGSEYQAQWERNSSGRMVCTCDTVCTCNTVCTCEGQCGCEDYSGGGGGGGSYSYTYTYPN